MDELYLDNIDEYVLDQDKIVTYKWLSLTLGVHVNTAKRMLYHYLEHKRKESSAPLHATYLLSGKSEDSGHTCHKVSVVREEELEEAKSKLSLVVSVHVYSVHKALLRDSGPLYSVDYDAVKSNLHNCNRYSAIRCPDAVPLSRAELEQVRESTRQPAPASPPQKTNGHAQLKAPPKPKGIMGIFANKPTPKNQEGVREVKSEPRDEEPTADVSKTKPTSKSSPMLNFFGTQSKKPVPSVKQEQTESSPRTEPPPGSQTTATPPPPPSNLQTNQTPSNTQDEETDPKQRSTKTRENRSKSKRVQSSDSEEEQMEKKKRRRIKKPAPDSSDDEVIPDSPPQTKPAPAPEPEPAPEATEDPPTHSHSQQLDSSSVKMRKRRRVLKSKTFMDDEGCIVTEKMYESESYSEEEEPKHAQVKCHSDDRKKKPSSSSSKPKNRPQPPTKQASIMGFFSKK